MLKLAKEVTTDNKIKTKGMDEMKLYSKETLLFGGLYELLSIPFAYAEIDNFSGMLLFFFAVGVLLIFVNKTPRFIKYILDNYPKSAYYCSSFGWLPYCRILTIIVLFCWGVVFTPDDNFFDTAVKLVDNILSFGLPASLLIAFAYSKTIKSPKSNK